MKLKSLTPMQVKINACNVYSISNKCGFEFSNPSYGFIPHTSHLFKENEEIASPLRDIENYLLNTAIVNLGTNEYDNQNELENKLEKREKDWFLNYSKLRGNVLSGYVGNNLFLLDYYLKFDEGLSIVKYNDAIDNYDLKSFNEKVRDINKLDKNLRQFLEIVYNKYE